MPDAKIYEFPQALPANPHQEELQRDHKRAIVAAGALALGALGFGIAHEAAFNAPPSMPEHQLLQDVQKHPDQFRIVNIDGGVGVDVAKKELAAHNPQSQEIVQEELEAQEVDDPTYGKILPAGPYVITRTALGPQVPKVNEAPVLAPFTPMNQQ